MGEWIKRNPVAYALINFALCILLASVLLRMYVDYKVNKEMIEIRQQLDSIEQSTNLIVDIIKENRDERGN
jgi:hypothetical protein